MLHEIGSHYANQKTSENNGFQIRGAKNVIKEEGLAILVERMFEGYKIKDSKRAGAGFPLILGAELLGRDERNEFLKYFLLMRSKGKNGITTQRELRLTRGYALERIGAQRKDCAYGRGVINIVQKIEKLDISIADFYKGKFSIEDISSGRVDGFVDFEKVVFPMFFADMVIYLIGKPRDEFTHANFISYLKEKYRGDIPDEYFEKIEIIKMVSKMKFARIMKLIPSFELIP